MGKKKSKFTHSGIKELDGNKPIVYRIKTEGGKDNYIGSSKRYQGSERIADHLDEIPGVSVEIKQYDRIDDAREAEARLIKKHQPKYNKKGK